MKNKITFTIKAGKHYAGNFFRFRIAWGNQLRVKFKVSHSAYYNYHEVINGWSKIIGLCEYTPHSNSARLAFINSTAGLQLAAYGYYQGKRRTVKVLTTFLPGTWYDLAIIRHKDKWEIDVSYTGSDLHDVDYLPAPRRRWLPFQFILHPYIGGRFTLDRDVVVEVIR